MSITQRCFPGPAGTTAGWSGGPTVSTATRSYSANAGGFVDCVSGDETVLASQGWINTGLMSGSSQSRQSATPSGFFSKGQLFLDVTVGKVLVFDSLSWRDVVSGAVVV
jgi:hypothetical protein